MGVNSSLLVLLSSIPLWMWTYHCLFNYLPVGGHLGCFQVPATTNKAATNIHVQVFTHKSSFSLG